MFLVKRFDFFYFKVEDSISNYFNGIYNINNCNFVVFLATLSVFAGQQYIFFYYSNYACCCAIY